MLEIIVAIIRLIAIWIAASFVCAIPACLFLKACALAEEAEDAAYSDSQGLAGLLQQRRDALALRSVA